MSLYPYPLREDPTPRPLPPFGLCCCFKGLCRGSQVVAGRLANGDICRAAIPACQRPVEPPTAALQCTACSPHSAAHGAA